MSELTTVIGITNQIIRREGGYNDIKGDAGGATNFGLSLRTARAVTKRDQHGYLQFDIDHDGDVDADDIRLVPREKVVDFYLNEFLRGPGIDKLPVPLMAVTYDISVNHGPLRAAMIVQSAVNKFSSLPMVVDGKIGPNTLRAAAVAYKTVGWRLVNQITVERVKRYVEICESNPSQFKFLVGWLNRAEEFVLRRAP